MSLPWVDKYKPTSLKHLVGQSGEKSPMNKLLGWLRDWPKYHMGEGAKQKKPRPPPWLAQSDGSSFKAVLLSGPPGIGKTTCALLACKELGLEYVEMNASDVRSKKLLDSKFSELMGCRQINQFFGKDAKVKSAQKGSNSNKLTHLLIMDEVDGMSGNEDRAGLAELIKMIKDTKIPVICICNDRQSPKMRTLVNYCFDLRFPRPRVEQIRSRIQTIVFQEKLKLTKEEVDDIIGASNHDVRQTIYNLQLLGRGGKQEIQKKDVAVNLFEAARLLLNTGNGLFEKERLFFVDYSIMPLFVQENYPNLVPTNASKKTLLNSLRRAADSISTGDLTDRIIRSTGSWSLLKEQRSFQEGTFFRIFADCCSLVTEYVPMMRDGLSLPLIRKENAGIPDVVAMLDEYDLTREDSDTIADVGTWSEMEDYRKKISTKVKSALTRTINKHSHSLPYSMDEVPKKRARYAAEPELEIDEEGNLREVNDTDELNEEEKGENDSEVSLPVGKPPAPKSESSEYSGFFVAGDEARVEEAATLEEGQDPEEAILEAEGGVVEIYFT
ncbi:unnamed protein product [Enterobius vermicularis]|uniref:AAA domain-containing protein n=1 Tax=Enterobius vermicularis TaxID=51028 RepID=A0A0N4V043_ENTVE|nr:unnamed protein product [Enterobius vermicularis]